jgi:hypothetical protein
MRKAKATLPAFTASDDDMDLLDNDESPLIKMGLHLQPAGI